MTKKTEVIIVLTILVLVTAGIATAKYLTKKKEPTNNTVETTTQKPKSTPVTEKKTTTTTTTTTTTKKAPEPEVSLPQTSTKNFSYIAGIYEKGGNTYIKADYAQFYSGNDANIEARKDGAIGKGETVDNDYYIRNVNKKIRELKLSPSAQITVSTYNIETESIKTRSLSFAKFVSIFKTNDPKNTVMIQNPYWLTVKGTTVTKLVEQYLP